MACFVENNICIAANAYTARKFNWWRYCLALWDEIFDPFPLFDETLRHIELCNSVISEVCQNFSNSVQFLKHLTVFHFTHKFMLFPVYKRNLMQKLFIISVVLAVLKMLWSYNVSPILFFLPPPAPNYCTDRERKKCSEGTILFFC